MNESKPPMPKMPTIDSANFSESPKDSAASNELNVGSNEDVKPEIIDPSDTSSVINVTAPSDKGIEVIADRKGFFNQTRIFKGEGFKVKNFSALGEWMICKDPVIEKKRKEFFKDKKARK